MRVAADTMCDLARPPRPGVTAPSIDNPWWPTKDGDDRARGLFDRHYSRNPKASGRLFVGPGEKLVLLTLECRALWVWRRFVEVGQDAPRGVNCAVFRNEGRTLSSMLVHAAEEWAAARWPGEVLYTYVNPAAIRSPNPGYCFKAAARAGPAGYRYRFAGSAACDALNGFYVAYSLYLNFFRPVKLMTRSGQEMPPRRVREPATPYELMLASGALGADGEDRLAVIYEAVDPVLLNEQIDELIERVMHYAE